MKMAPRLGLKDLFDASPLQRVQVVTIALCALVAVVDGFNVQSMPVSAPEIARLWRVAPSAFGAVFSAGALGNVLGNLIAGIFADRFGRRRVLLGSLLVFGLALLAMPFASSMPRLTLVWAGASLAVGGMAPGIVSITSEYAPARLRSTLISVMMCGTPLGGAAGGLVAAHVIPAFGWRSIFYLCSAASLALVLALFAFLPESVRFLAVRGDRAGVTRILNRLGWTERWNGELVKDKEHLEARQASVGALFRAERATGTVLLWTTSILSLLVTFFLINWLPTLELKAGIGLRGAILGISALNLGAVCGCLIIGRSMDRFGPVVPIATGYTLGAVAVASLGLVGQSAPLLLLVAFLVGMTTMAPQFCIMALVASFYPTAMRATGVGWTHGVGKVGAITGPLIGGALIAAGVSGPPLFAIGGLLLLGAACTVMGIRPVLRRTAPPATACPKVIA